MKEKKKYTAKSMQSLFKLALCIGFVVGYFTFFLFKIAVGWII